MIKKPPRIILRQLLRKEPNFYRWEILRTGYPDIPMVRVRFHKLSRHNRMATPYCPFILKHLIRIYDYDVDSPIWKRYNIFYYGKGEDNETVWTPDGAQISQPN